MDRQAIIDVVNRVVGDVMEIDLSKIEPNHSFEELEFDSLAIIEVVEAIEEELEIKRALEEEELRDLKRLSDLYDLVESRLKEQEG